MTVAAIIQARMTSSRLPGKTLAPIVGRPMLSLMLERLARAQTLDIVIVAATDRLEDDPIEELCAEENVACFRGSETDVLARFHGAAAACAPNAEALVRLTADCPLIDHAIIDGYVGFYLAHKDRFDYVWEGSPPKIPNGFGCEVFARAALDAAQANATSDYDREHVTPYLRDAAHGFRIGAAPAQASNASARLSVDTAEDLAVARAVFEALYPDNPAFTLEDVLAFLRSRPDVVALNADVEQTTGPYAKSFSENLE